MATVLSLVQKACYQSGLAAPNALVSATDAASLQYLNLFYATGEDLRSGTLWPQLKRKHTVVLSAGRSQYQLPPDYYTLVPETSWDQNNHWQMRGPISDGGMNNRTYGYVTIENRKAFRVFGPDQGTSTLAGQFQITPVPGSGEAGQILTFEYISKSWLTPPAWVASATYAGPGTTTYVTVSGNNYQDATAGSHAAGTVPPSVGAASIGQDGGILWQALTTAAWGSTTAYGPGEYVTNGGNLYVCKIGGTSAGSGGPTGTNTTTNVTDGTVSWLYLTTATWAAETSFSSGTYCVTSSRYYKNVTPANTLTGSQVSAKKAPTWTAAGAEVDNAVTWNYVPATYDTLITDLDLCLFDDDLMVLGLKTRYLQAHRMDFEDFLAEYERLKGRAKARYNPNVIISLSGGGYSRYPNVGDGNFNGGTP